MSKEDSTFLRGFWCIIVVLVHVPMAYQNRIQDMLGSFAFIGVTFFFMTSAYGLKWSLKYKRNYLSHFWGRRLPSILIPAFIANAIGVIARAYNGEHISAFSFLRINNWVKVLLLLYFLFWVVYYIVPKIIKLEGYWQDILICLLVCGCSLIDRLTPFKITSIWTVEPLGFAYGILAANNNEFIRKWLKEKWVLKVSLLFLSSIALGLAYLKFKYVVFLGDYLLKIILGIGITAFMFSLLSKVRVGNKANRFLGSISYEVYLLHGTIFYILMAMDPGRGINSGLFVIASVCITIIIAYIINSISKPLSKRLSIISGE